MIASTLCATICSSKVLESLYCFLLATRAILCQTFSPSPPPGSFPPSDGVQPLRPLPVGLEGLRSCWLPWRSESLKGTRHSRPRHEWNHLEKARSPASTFSEGEGCLGGGICDFSHKASLNEIANEMNKS